MRIGVLALQGDYSQHQRILDQLGYQCILVRYPRDLTHLEGLVLPGGESTTQTRLMVQNHLLEPLKEFAQSYPVLGTCAGLILMARKVKDPRVQCLRLLDVEVDRNAYGRQIHSFNRRLKVNLRDSTVTLPATFIRAPKITRTEGGVSVLAAHQGLPCAVQEGKHVGLSFHPELDGVTTFHEYCFNPSLSRSRKRVKAASHAA